MLRQPALEPAGEGPAKGRPIAARREAWCLMLDGTWQLVRVAGWQHNGERWQCLLQWGVEGTVYGCWYLHDPDRLAAIPGPEPSSNPPGGQRAGRGGGRTITTKARA